jgi:hypothetical protein
MELWKQSSGCILSTHVPVFPPLAVSSTALSKGPSHFVEIPINNMEFVLRKDKFSPSYRYLILVKCVLWMCVLRNITLLTKLAAFTLFWFDVKSMSCLCQN